MVDIRPTEIVIGNNKYYNADNLSKYDSAYFYGCSRTARNILKKRAIDRTNYVYATWNKKTGWAISVDQNKPATKASLLLVSKWVVENIPKMMPQSDESKELAYDYPEAPEIIVLSDEEKFRDNDDKTVEIETRGERTPKDIYFLASDVSRVFEMPNIVRSLNDAASSYIINEDYKIFLNKNYKKNENLHAKKQTYLTYDGMIHVLFASHSKKAKTFRKWATETLFTIQMGSKEQKEELVSGIIGVPAKSLRQVLKSSAASTPCIYRFALGTAKQLRKIMNLSDDIPDDHIIIKYGYTDDLLRRTAEHVKTYEKITGTNIELMEYVYIDPKFLSQAEVKIKEFFNDIEIPINYESFVELVAINPKHEKMIKQQFKYLHTEFSGSIRELVEKIEKLKTDHHISLMNKDGEIIAERHISELLKKDLTIAKHELANAQLKNELLEMKLLVGK